MKVLYQILSLILTLLTLDSGTGTGTAIFQFSVDLVFEISKIQNAKGVRIPLNEPHPYTPDIRHPVWLNLALILGEVRNCVILPRLHNFVRDAKKGRKLKYRKRLARLVRIARRRYRGWKYEYNHTLGFPGEGWLPFSAVTWNTHSLTEERFEYAKSLDNDITALTEL